MTNSKTAAARLLHRADRLTYIEQQASRVHLLTAMLPTLRPDTNILTNPRDCLISQLVCVSWLEWPLPLQPQFQLFWVF